MSKPVFGSVGWLVNRAAEARGEELAAVRRRVLAAREAAARAEAEAAAAKQAADAAAAKDAAEAASARAAAEGAAERAKAAEAALSEVEGEVAKFDGPPGVLGGAKGPG